VIVFFCYFSRLLYYYNTAAAAAAAAAADDDDDDNVIKVSKPLSLTRSAYLFIIIDGQLSAYSLATGQKLLRLDYSNSLPSDGKMLFLSLLHL